MNHPCSPRATMLLAVVLLCGLCIAANKAMAKEDAAAQPTKSDKRRQASSTMPAALLGVWHRDDAYGRRSCDAYRSVGSTIDTDEESYSLIGSLVITKDLVHAYAEYGEGDFNAVKLVADLDNQKWKVDVLVYVDNMPSEGAHESKDTLRFVVESGLLSMTSEMDRPEVDEDVSRYFRCGDVIDRLYED